MCVRTSVLDGIFGIKGGPGKSHLGAKPEFMQSFAMCAIRGENGCQLQSAVCAFTLVCHLRNILYEQDVKTTQTAGASDEQLKGPSAATV